MVEKRTSQEALVELIDSGQFLSAEEIFSERRTDAPMEMVIRAEVESYFGRFESAASLLEQVAPRIAEIDVAARYSLASGRLALNREDYEQAYNHYQAAYYFYQFLRDSFGLAQSLIGLAHLARARGELEMASEMLSRAQEEVRGRASKRSEYVRGLIVAEQAAIAFDRGEIGKALELYSEAINMLKNTERGRNYGYALIGLASVKCAEGEYQESLELYKEANTVFERYDLKRELAESQIETARALIRLQRYDRAEKLAESSRNLRRGDPAGESAALALLGQLALKRGDLNEAAMRAAAAVEAADRSRSIIARAQARAVLGQIRMAEREFKLAVDILREAADLAGQLKTSKSRRLELEATILLAEAYHSVDTRAGRAELERAAEILKITNDAWLSEEYQRVSSKYQEQIILTEDNRLIFDGNQLPKWQEAKRTLEAFLLRNALRQTDDSLTRAARKLGVSKVHVHNLKKKYKL
jgi:tetratricopeptide (TPR) repeat protein